MSRRTARWPVLTALSASALFAAGALVPLLQEGNSSGQRAETGGLAAIYSQPAGVSVQVVAAPAETGLMRQGLLIAIDHGSDGQPDVVVTSSAAVEKALSPTCVSGALAMLIRQELGANGEPSYLAHLSMDVIDAAYEGGRFAGPFVDTSSGLMLAAMSLALTALAFRVDRIPTVHTHVASPVLLAQRDRLRFEVARLEQALQTARATRESVVEAAPIPMATRWDWLPGHRAHRIRRHRAMLDTVKSKFDRNVSSLKRNMEVAERAIDLNQRRMRDDQLWFESVQRWQTLGSVVAREGARLSCAVLLVVSTVFAAVSITGAMPTVGRDDAIILLRPDTLVAVALAAESDLPGVFAHDCGMQVVDQVRDQTFKPVASPVVISFPESGESTDLLTSGGLRCRTGLACGNTCIPFGRICRLDKQVAHAQACGRSYIALEKTCRLAAVDTDQRLQLLPSRLNNSAPTPQTQDVPIENASSSASPRYQSDQPVMPGLRSGPRRTSTPVPPPSRSVDVRGYTRSTGSVVEPYVRAAPRQSNGGGRH